jgi:hypothetical protein
MKHKPACDAHDAEVLLAGQSWPRVGMPDGLESAAGVTRPRARMGIELAIPTGNNPGVLAQVLHAVAGRKVNILAYCTSFDQDGFTLLLVTDDALAAKAALATAGLRCTAHSVVLVRAEDRAGTTPAILLNHLCKAGIDIWYVYVAALKPAELFTIFKTVDDRRALHVLAAANLVHTASR